MRITPLTLPSSFSEISNNRVIPAGYKRLNFIQSTGTQYIKTAQDGMGWLVEDFDSLEIEMDAALGYGGISVMSFSVVCKPDQAPYAFGCSNENYGSSVRGDLAAYQCVYGSQKAGTQDIRLAFGENASVYGMRRKMRGKPSTRQIWIDDKEITSFIARGGDGNGYRWGSLMPFVIGAYPYKPAQGTGFSVPSGKYFRFTVYEHGEKVHDAIPCLDRQGIPCLFDIITRRTYYNSGSGQFLWG